jgi:hypothetical protein
MITLVKEKIDLCEHVKEVDLECPINKGKLVLTKNIDMPKQIPPVRSSDTYLPLFLSFFFLEGIPNLFENLLGEIFRYHRRALGGWEPTYVFACRCCVSKIFLSQ